MPHATIAMGGAEWKPYARMQWRVRRRSIVIAAFFDVTDVWRLGIQKLWPMWSHYCAVDSKTDYRLPVSRWMHCRGSRCHFSYFLASLRRYIRNPAAVILLPRCLAIHSRAKMMPFGEEGATQLAWRKYVCSTLEVIVSLRSCVNPALLELISLYIYVHVRPFTHTIRIAGTCTCLVVLVHLQAVCIE